ncbi:hypothetical protein ACN38_g11510 [Penicillium nordicum]|uniref:Uncharacterized protein n=1 Tax=Penicillium nordicum TaxID=229535 RepID=A0A0M8NR41_9EURO|nr:hypothetical protein ACN38_g11510 [Penicillium nordicum]
MDGPVRSTDPHRPHYLIVDWLCLTAWKVLIDYGPIRKGSRRFFFLVVRGILRFLLLLQIHRQTIHRYASDLRSFALVSFS